MKIRLLLITLAAIPLILIGCANSTIATDTKVKASAETTSFKESALKLQLETEHFEFYSTDGDKKCLEDLSGEVEGSYDRVVKDLQTPLDYKPKINIYPDIESFHKSIGRPNDSAWGVGTAWGKDLKMVSPLNPGPVHDYNSIKQVAVHEFVHVVEINMTNPKSLTTWLWEGVAMYEAKQVDNKTKNTLRQLVENKKSPALSQLDKEFYTIDDAYAFSYTIVDFMVDRFGYDKLVQVIKEPNDIEKILGVSMDEFEKQWLDFVKANYVLSGM